MGNKQIIPLICSLFAFVTISGCNTSNDAGDSLENSSIIEYNDSGQDQTKLPEITPSPTVLPAVAPSVITTPSPTDIPSVTKTPNQTVSLDLSDTSSLDNMWNNGDLLCRSFAAEILGFFDSYYFFEDYIFEKYGDPIKETDARMYFAQGFEIDADWSISDEPSIGAFFDLTNYIYISRTCSLKTRSGIGIGSTRAEVMDACSGIVNTVETDETQIVVGTDLNGVYFMLENDIVSAIYIGTGSQYYDQSEDRFYPDRETGVPNKTVPVCLLEIKNGILLNCTGSGNIVSIPNSVTAIGDRAFYSCSALTSITIPDSVTAIGRSAFGRCEGLTNIIIPNSVTTIEREAFFACSGLASITIPNSVIKIDEEAFRACSGLASITIPNSVKTIGDLAFIYCSGLTSITIPNNVTAIGTNAFACCNKLMTIDVEPSNEYYTSLDGVLVSKDKTILVAYPTGSDGTYTIPNSVTTIGEYAFNSCFRLTSIIIPNSVTTIGYNAFYGCSGITSVAIPNSVTTIGGGAFRECSKLTSITIPNSVTTIGGSAFNNCRELMNITLPNSVTAIEEKTFYWCARLTSIVIPNSVTTIGGGAFDTCSGLTSITIPNSVTRIGDYSFARCSGLASITIPESVVDIGDYVFLSCSSSLIIYGAARSYTESYANDNAMNFVAIT